MAVRERALQQINGGNSIEFGPPPADRASLESAASAGTVEFYLLTEAANRAWAAISASLASGAGAVFWISGPAGAGKTHFLNYLLALEERAGTTKGRRAIVRLGLDALAGAFNLEQRIFEMLARELGADDAGATLWRRLHGGEALAVAFERAHRVGIRAISVAIDFGAIDSAAWEDCVAELARAASRTRQVAFNVFVAARSRAPAGAMALEVTPADGKERMLAAVARARRVVDEAAVASLYDRVELDGFEPRAIFPFDPRAMEMLSSLVGKPASVAAMAKLVSAALMPYRETADGWLRPLLPVELMEVSAIAKRVEERLAEAGRIALRVAHRAADAMEECECARGIVDALMLERLIGNAQALAPGELRTRLPQRYQRRGSATAASAAIAAMLEALTVRADGVITFDGREAQFNPRAAGASEVEAFNNALSFFQRFDSTLGEAADLSEARIGLKRAGDAMTRAVEAAHRVGATLEAARRDLRVDIKPEHRRTLADFVALADAGAIALTERAADPHARTQTERLLAAYESLTVAGAAVPRIREMRSYLQGSALTSEIIGGRDDIAEGRGGVDKTVAVQQVECQLLLGALDSGVAMWEPRSLDILEIRFQKFKWSYIELYRIAHERWRRDSERMAIELADARERLAALTRLNSIAALGAPAGGGLESQIDRLAREVAQCASDAPLTLDLAPRCPRCEFVLGRALPSAELAEVLEEMRRAFKAKLSALSQSAIARLIRRHDRGHRLDGFLKIIQAAHTDALVRVLDDNLARYLGRLLDERPGVVRPLIKR